MQKNIMTVNKGLGGIDTMSENTKSLGKFFRGKLNKILFVVGSVAAVIGINEIIKNSDTQADKLFFSGQNMSFSGPGESGQSGLGTQNSNGLNNPNQNFESAASVKSDVSEEKIDKNESSVEKKEVSDLADKTEGSVPSSGIELVDKLDTKDMIVSIENNHLKIVLHKDARKKILENEDYEDYDGAFISVMPTMGVGNGYDGTFDPDGINYIPLSRIFDNNGGQGEVIVSVSNGENNNNIFLKVNIRNNQIVTGGDLVVNNSRLPEIADR